MANQNLHGAKKAKNDEFYTQFHDIEKEMNATSNTTPMCSKARLSCCRVMTLSGATSQSILPKTLTSWG